MKSNIVQFRAFVRGHGNHEKLMPDGVTDRFETEGHIKSRSRRTLSMYEMEKMTCTHGLVHLYGFEIE